MSQKWIPNSQINIFWKSKRHFWNSSRYLGFANALKQHTSYLQLLWRSYTYGCFPLTIPIPRSQLVDSIKNVAWKLPHFIFSLSAYMKNICMWKSGTSYILKLCFLKWQSKWENFVLTGAKYTNQGWYIRGQFWIENWIK